MRTAEQDWKEGWTDVHSHFLPAMDDGCRNSKESLLALQMMKEQGITAVAATPHYYPTESIGEFLKRRENSWIDLQKEAEQQHVELPQICFAAEVAYRGGISRDPMLPELCYGKSEYILLEMPFRRWTGSCLHEVEIISRSYGLIPVIAHFERYEHYQTKSIINELFDMDIRIQMNAEYLLGFWTSSKACTQIKDGITFVLGSDCHNITNRPPLIGKAVEKLAEKRMTEEMEELRRNGVTIMEAAL